MKRFDKIIADFYITLHNLKDLRDGKFEVEDTSADVEKTPDSKQEEITVSQEEGTQQ